MSRTLLASGPFLGRGKRKEKGNRRQRFEYPAKENPALQVRAPSVETSPHSTSVATLILRGILRMCLRSHSFVTTGLVHSRSECWEPSAAQRRPFFARHPLVCGRGPIGQCGSRQQRPARMLAVMHESGKSLGLRTNPVLAKEGAPLVSADGKPGRSGRRASSECVSGPEEGRSANREDTQQQINAGRAFGSRRDRLST